MSSKYAKIWQKLPTNGKRPDSECFFLFFIKTILIIINNVAFPVRAFLGNGNSA